MSRLVVNPGSPGAWEIKLKPGVNLIGRGPTSDFQITEPSISGAHCQVILSGQSASIKDLGSTNGTYINRVPVKEALLLDGQTVHVGALEMTYRADAPAAPTATAIPVARPALRPVVRQTSQPPAIASAAPPPVPPVASAATAAAPISVGPQNCKFHPRSPARFFCGTCQHYFCDLCVTIREAGGVKHKVCRRCSTECTPVQAQVVLPPSAAGFFSRLPGAFAFPFRGSGFWILLLSAIVFAALRFISGGLFAIFAKIAFVGYVFSWMQLIIHATANEEDHMPGLPGMDDVFGGCFRLLGCVVLSFWLAIGCAGYGLYFQEPLVTLGVLPGMILGCIYFPMALLAVAMKDSVVACNPLVVVPAMFRAPLEYLVTLIVVAMVVGFWFLANIVMVMAFGVNPLLQPSISVFLAYAGASAVWNLIVVYLLALIMRVLGLLYLARKHKLGWFRR